MLILVPNNKKILLGILKDFCLGSKCLIKTFEPDNNENFIKVLNKESPSAVILGMLYTVILMDSPRWAEIRSFLKKNNTMLYGFEDFSFRNDKANPNILFYNYKNFTKPLTIGEILPSLQGGMSPIKVRRAGERRSNGGGWRMSNKEQAVTLLETAPFSNNVLNKSDMANCSAKPFSNNILPFRIRDKSNNQRVFRQRLCLGPLCINYEERKISINGISVEISPKEFQIVELLAEQPGSVIKVEDIIKKVWPGNKNATKADVHHNLYMLRKKLEKDAGNQKLIVTVKGFGYKLWP